MWQDQGLMAGPRTMSFARAVACVVGAAVMVQASCKLFDVTAPAGDAGTGVAPIEAGTGFLGFVPTETAVRACSKILSCPVVLSKSLQSSLAISIDATNFSHCVDALAGPLDPDRLNRATSERLECLASAKTCDEANRCMLYQIDVPPDPRCANAKATSICIDDGRAVLVCEAAANSIRVDCANPAFPPGASCQIFVDAQGNDHGFCVVSTPCPASGNACRGTTFDGCVLRDDSIGKAEGHQIIDCAAGGLRCVTTQTGCAGERCIDVTETTCTSTRMAVCGLAEITNVDCAHIGATCIKSNTAVACARDGDECNVFDEPRKERCIDPETINVCIGGKNTTFSCASVGMKCVPAAGIRSSYCAP
jgi:hypothetical protein